MRKLIWLFCGVLCGGAVIWYLCLHKKSVLPMLSADAPEVVVQHVYSKPIIITHEYIGHVEAIHAVSVYPYISGFIDKVLVDGGAEVTIGQTLFVLKQDQYLAEVEAAEAKVVGATADLEKAKLYLDRLNNTASEAISKTEKDDARTAFLTSEAALKGAQAALKLAKANYDYTVITATINGVVGNINVTRGEYVYPTGQALAYVLQYNPIRVRFSMPEKDFLNLGANVHFFETGTLNLRLSNGKIISAAGSVRFADNQVHSGTSSIDLFADFENKNHLLLPGSYVTVLYDEEIPSAILIDRPIVSMQPKGNYVYVLKNGIIEKQQVELGPFVGTQVVVTKGLSADDLLIITPVLTNDVGKKAITKTESDDDIF